MTRSRARYGPAALAVLGWYATVCIAFVVGMSARPEPPLDPECTEWCMTHGQWAVVLLVIAAPEIALALGVSLGLAAVLVRFVGSSILAGTLATAAALIAGVLLLVLQ